MTEKILLVDDEQNVLDGLRRQLRKKYRVETALGGEAGLKAVQENGPFAVIVSDMKMPGMDGARFLQRARERDPDSVRMILSGQSELDSAISAINDGNIFRFLTKPCDTETLIRVLDLAIDQHRLVIAERELLEKTLGGAVSVLTEVLSLVNPEAFSRSSRIRHYAEEIGRQLGLDEPWRLRLAALLSQIGSITLPAELLAKAYSTEPLSDEESAMYATHPKVAAKLVESIPRLEAVARMIAGQLEAPATPLSEDAAAWDPVTTGSEILRVVVEFDRLTTVGVTPEKALTRLRTKTYRLPSLLVDALGRIEPVEAETVVKTVRVKDLQTKMIVDQDIRTRCGVRLVPKGEEITYAMLERLRNFAQRQSIDEPFRVLVKL